MAPVAARLYMSVHPIDPPISVILKASGPSTASDTLPRLNLGHEQTLDFEEE